MLLGRKAISELFHGWAALTEIFYVKCASKILFPRKPKLGLEMRSQGGKSPKLTQPSETSIVPVHQYGAWAPWLSDQALSDGVVCVLTAQGACSPSTRHSMLPRDGAAVKPAEPLSRLVPTGICHLAASRPEAKDAKG